MIEQTKEQIATWQLGWQRYEKARRLNPRQWAELHKRNLAGERFDGMIDALDHDGGVEMVAAPVVPVAGLTEEQISWLPFARSLVAQADATQLPQQSVQPDVPETDCGNIVQPVKVDLDSWSKTIAELKGVSYEMDVIYE